jgi:hypothetical protein
MRAAYQKTNNVSFDNNSPVTKTDTYYRVKTANGYVRVTANEASIAAKRGMKASQVTVTTTVTPL